MGVKSIDIRRMEELREEMGVKEFHEEAGEEMDKVDWTNRMNGRGTVDKGSRCTESGE